MAGINLDDLEKALDADTQEAKGNTTTSSGGFDLLAGIEDDLDKGQGQSWIAEKEGDTLIGYVKAVDQIRSDYPVQSGPKAGEYLMLPLLDIEDRDGTLWTVRGYGSALSNQLEKGNPKPGDAIAIRFVGMATPKNPAYKAYKNYVVTVRKPA